MTPSAPDMLDLDGSGCSGKPPISSVPNVNPNLELETSIGELDNLSAFQIKINGKHRQFCVYIGCFVLFCFVILLFENLKVSKKKKKTNEAPLCVRVFERTTMNLRRP